jgi:gamma-glutamyl-gamma-aminobutyraldehyde dehydrogenase
LATPPTWISRSKPSGQASGRGSRRASADLGKAHRFARDVEAGMVYVNSYKNGDMQFPFGGWKHSGNGRDKCFDALVSYTQTKGVWTTIG